MTRRNRHLWLPFAAALSCGAALATNEPVRVERVPVNGGAELITVISSTPEGDVPLVSMLRDTLGDDRASNDRLRQVWLLGEGKPAWHQRLAAATPFYYWRARQNASAELSGPVVDLSDSRRRGVETLVKRSLQWLAFEGNAWHSRSSMLAYNVNSSAYHSLVTSRAIAALRLASEAEPNAALLPPADRQAVQARLILSDRLLGGLIPDDRLARVWARSAAASHEALGQNWDLLRQAAENNGLYFRPLAVAANSPSYAMLWVAKADLDRGARYAFDDSFLRIADPWTDSRLRRWRGYTENGMIPLALYSLEHPRSPLLLVDFRSSGKPRRREITARAAGEVTRGVLNLNSVWSFRAALALYDFVRSRRGAAVDARARVRAYSQFSYLLGLDGSLAPGLRDEIERHLRDLSLTPLGGDVGDEARLARERHAKLLACAAEERCLPARLERDRRLEAVQLAHGRRARVLLTAATAATLGLYRHREKMTPELTAELDHHRRAEYHRRFLERVLASGDTAEVVWDMDRVRRSAYELATLVSADRKLRLRNGAIQLLSRLATQTRDDATRRECLTGIAALGPRPAAAAAAATRAGGGL